MKLTAGKTYKFSDRNEIHVGMYMGRQKGFECCVCDKGCNAYTFNIYHSGNESDYETWGYGKEHMPEIIEDLKLETWEIIADK